MTTLSFVQTAACCASGAIATDTCDWLVIEVKTVPSPLATAQLWDTPVHSADPPLIW